MNALQRGWCSPLAELGAEIEGHPLGGGMLKLEPREAARIPIPVGDLLLTHGDEQTLTEAVLHARKWRHHA